MGADSRQGLDDGAVFITVIQNGTSEVKKLSGPGGTMRVAVGRPGRRSAIWRIWAPSNKPNVYVKNSDVWELKLSLHGEQDGRSHWHYAFERAEQAIEHTGSSKRWLDDWDRPEPISPGWTPAFRVQIPGAYMTNVPGDVPLEDVLWVTAPSDEESISIWIFIASPTAAEHGFLVDATPLGGFSLTSGEAVVVMAALNTLTDEEWSLIRRAHEAILQDPADFDFGTDGAQRAGVLMQNDQSGLRTLLEVAPYPEPPQ
jgi:hypothetical protein